MRAGPEIRSVVRFLQLNLHADSYAVGDGLDLIFCRNVLIYFDAASRAGVVGRLISRLAEAGMLFLGHAESLNGTTVQARSVIPTVYARSA
jgi:chemotaxis protein methyltransferase CheR